MTSRLVTLGESMALFRTRGIGSSAHETEFLLGIGGAESNVAIGVTRLGGSAVWLGRVGADALGDRIVREIRGEGVDVRPIVDAHAATGLMLKERRTTTRTRVTYYRRGSAGSRLEPSDLDADFIRNAGVLHVTGITPALSPTAAATVDFAIELAVDAGVPISFDVNHRSSLWHADEAAPVYRRIISRASIVFCGEAEAVLIVGVGHPAQLAKSIADLGPREVVIKLGAQGCHALIDGQRHIRPAIPIEPVDTVGAGDAFVAGYLAERLAGAPASSRLDTAVRAGAFACLVPGDWEGLPHRKELSLLDDPELVER